MKTRMTLTERMASKQQSAVQSKVTPRPARQQSAVQSKVTPRPAGQNKERSSSENKSLFLSSDTITSITFSNLRVAPYDVIRLLDVKITHGVNEHGTLYFKALLSEEKGDQYVESKTEGMNVELNVTDPTGHNYVLFQGIVKDVKVSADQDMYHLEVEAISYSHLLDLKLKSKSFQDEGMSYSDLLQSVTSEYTNAGVIDKASNGATIDKLVLQHKETDFEFMKRMASHFESVLICDVRFDSPKCYVGLPPAKSVTLDNFNYTVQKNVKKFRDLSKNGVQGLNENDFISYEIQTDQTLQVGSEVNFRGRQLYVSSIVGKVDQGVFLNHCVLTSLNGLKQKHVEHDKVVGSSFNGKIIDIKNDRVKVHLDIDPEQSVQTACFFPYSTIYSSEDGSGWYCMPELSDNVRVYIPDGNEGNAYAISSVHEAVSATLPSSSGGGASSAASSGGGASSAASSGGGGASSVASSGGGGASSSASSGGGGPSSGNSSSDPSAPPSPSEDGINREDPDIKLLRSACGKTIELSPEGILIDAGSSQIALTEGEGIKLYSENDIKFNADKDIVLKAEEEIQIIGGDYVEISAGDLGLVKVEEDVEIVGYEVKSN